jgi:hypothetical protein
MDDERTRRPPNSLGWAIFRFRPQVRARSPLKGVLSYPLQSYFRLHIPSQSATSDPVNRPHFDIHAAALLGSQTTSVISGRTAR